VTRGEYLVHARRVISCHTVAAEEKLAGAGSSPPRLDTSTSETSHRSGKRYRADRRAVSAITARGGRPDGAKLLSGVSRSERHRHHRPRCHGDQAYLFSLPPVAPGKPAQDVPFPSPWRSCQRPAWKAVFFTPGQCHPPRAAVFIYNRGAYIERARDCGECHTPRNSSAQRNPVSGWPDAGCDGDGQARPT